MSLCCFSRLREMRIWRRVWQERWTERTRGNQLLGMEGEDLSTMERGLETLAWSCCHVWLVLKASMSEVWLIAVVQVERLCLGEVEDQPKGFIAFFCFPGLTLQLAEGFSDGAAHESHEKCCSSELASLHCRAAEHWLSICTGKKAGRSCFCGLNVARGPRRCRFKSNFCCRLTTEVWVSCLPQPPV